MIVANIKDAERYYSVNPEFQKVFEFLKSLDEFSENVSVNDDGYSASVFETETSDVEPDGSPIVLEAHKNYIDIHYCVDGNVAIGYADIAKLKVVKEYVEEHDYLLLRGDMSKLILSKGDFCIVFPEDAHAPSMCAGDDKMVKKAVVKIKDNV